ncbi:MAG: hypothetical protein UW22_C0066G0004 [Candidatus Gottesmanbacteria bacterium GW2011_GWB1_44_11c]|uniref:KilA-N DNA-binding domain-containing protein n=1 Tax=Candidatus Gottesmanbacteria bacterium GW2011_GWB1_44_11c TaxID=1618447 RepID=A0A0G1JHB3_9BACT|nr:MAG: hypothetical protein UW22_C0066G0004 [Candidatus Gottesmanbacteria bacterium GW2011_GWB1_44_11c]
MIKKSTKSLVSINTIERKILIVRNEKVILDSDLAELYGVTTGALNQAIKRNKERFPSDFAFTLTPEEIANLKSQIVISSSKHGGRRRSRPHAFTEHGVLMAANVLKSKLAIQVSIQIVRTFVLMRQTLAANSNLSRKLDNLEKKYDKQFAVIFQAIRALISSPAPTRRKIGFRTK